MCRMKKEGKKIRRSRMRKGKGKKRRKNMSLNQEPLVDVAFMFPAESLNQALILMLGREVFPAQQVGAAPLLLLICTRGCLAAGFSRTEKVLNMYLDIEMPGNVVVSPEDLHGEGLKLQEAIILRLLEDVSKRKATKEHGYFLAVTTLNHIGDGKVRELSGDVLFPVVYSCITFKPFKGEVLRGVVCRILKHGIFLKCGPIENIFLSKQMMKEYDFISGENPTFMNNKLSKLEKDAVVQFRVLGLKWMEPDREFQMLATLAGDFLGPIS